MSVAPNDKTVEAIMEGLRQWRRSACLYPLFPQMRGGCVWGRQI